MTTETTATPTLLDALMTLQRAGDRRRVSRRALREAVTALENEILKQTRVGDTVIVGSTDRTLAVRKIGYYGCQGERHSGWPIMRSRETFACLTLDGGVLVPPEGESWFDGHNMQHQLDRAAIYDAQTDEDAPLATDADRSWLATHAAEVVAAFAALHQAEAAAFEAAADAAQTGRV